MRRALTLLVHEAAVHRRGQVKRLAWMFSIGKKIADPNIFIKQGTWIIPGWRAATLSKLFIG